MESKTKRKYTGILSLFLAFVLSVSVLAPTAAAVQAPANTVVTATGSTVASAKTKVAYGTSKYPNLSNVGYDTFRKLDYQEKAGLYTYFYDFRDTWYAGCKYPDGKYATSLGTNCQGFWGIRASTKDSVLTYEAFTDLDNVTVAAVQFRTFDDAQNIVLDATPNVEHTCKTGNLKNGPYTLCVWFDYVHEDGTVETIGAWQTVYVSGGHGWFADFRREADDQAMKTWLSGNRDKLVADDAFQAWVAKQGGNDLDKATDVTVIHYPFKSGTSRYPDDSSKWRALAHEICPDEDASDYAKAYALFAWMQSNLAYDKDALTATENGDYRWAVAAASGTAKGYTMYDSHLGQCADFANVYAIMCRELGIPCHVVSTPGHGFNATYLNGRWELVDVNAGVRNARVGTDNKTYAANVKAYWAKQKTGDDYTVILNGFCDTAYSTFKIGSYEKDKYANIEDKITKNTSKLNVDLQDAAFYTKWAGTIYGH